MTAASKYIAITSDPRWTHGVFTSPEFGTVKAVFVGWALCEDGTAVPLFVDPDTQETVEAAEFAMTAFPSFSSIAMGTFTDEEVVVVRLTVDDVLDYGDEPELSGPDK